MQFTGHINLTANALRRWFVAQCYDSLAVGALWWAGLWYLHVPFALFWAVLAAILQFIPHFGPVLTFVGPAVSALIADGFEGFLYVLILYGAVIVIDGLVLQPVIMRRTARVPIWASLTVPILLSLIFGFWGWLLAAPLLAIIFAYRRFGRREVVSIPRQTPPGQVITGGQLISPGGPGSNMQARYGGRRSSTRMHEHPDPQRQNDARDNEAEDFLRDTLQHRFSRQRPDHNSDGCQCSQRPLRNYLVILQRRINRHAEDVDQQGYCRCRRHERISLKIESQ
jgi:hypothetical protein